LSANFRDRTLAGRNKKVVDDALKGYDGYLRMILAEIVGVQH